MIATAFLGAVSANHRLHALLFALTLGLCSGIALASPPVARQVSGSVAEPAEAGLAWSDKPIVAGAQTKMSNRLLQLVRDTRSRGANRPAVLASNPSILSNKLQRISNDGNIQCYVHYQGDPQETATSIRKLGGTIEQISQGQTLIQASVPYDQIETLAAGPAVTHVRLPGYAITRSGSVNSQGDAVHRTDVVRNWRGWTGTGIKVGVISDGIGGIGTSQASGDIPPTYQAQSARSDGNLNAGAEGTAMMEIVHDLAPGAALAFSNPNTSAEMVSAINILDSTFHCKVICDDLGFSDDPWFEDGPVVNRINQAVANGAVYASAAGNDADQNYYQGDYVGMTQKIKNTNMDVQTFGAGDWNMQAYVQGNGGWIVVILQWNDPWGASGNDYDLLLTNSTGTTIYTASQDAQNGNDFPIEAVQYTNNTASGVYVQVVVRRYSGVPRTLKIASWGYGWFTEYYTAAGSIYGHPAGTNVIACGAVRASTPDTIETFSSRGPVRIDFPALTFRNKPDVCGADGVSVTGNGGFPTPFYGTSAAAPHVAAVCAQLWSAAPQLTNTQVRNLVQANTIDLSTPGFDTITGFGRADAFNQANALAPIPGDFDHDGYVTDPDIATFTACRTSPGIAYVGSTCQSADFDTDADIDQSDFGVFQRCLSGTSSLGDPACAALP